MVLEAVRLAGRDHEDENVALSADRRWLAISWWDVAVALFPDDTAAGPAPYVWAAEEGERLFPHRLSLEGGLCPRWRNATTLEFVSGNRYVTYDVTSGETDTVDIELRVPRDVPNGGSGRGRPAPGPV